MEQKTRLALQNARDDLCFAMTEMNSNINYDNRLFGTVVFITEVLEDKYEFKEIMRQRQMPCHDCKNKAYMRKCGIHGE